jgi:hypothetical protein
MMMINNKNNGARNINSIVATNKSKARFIIRFFYPAKAVFKTDSTADETARQTVSS